MTDNFLDRPHTAHDNGTVRQGGARNSPVRIVAIGASAGGPQALHVIIRSLPPDLSAPILCVQHIGAGFLQGLIDWLSLDSKLPIKIAEPGERPVPGTVYFPQEGAHLLVNSKGLLWSSMDAPVNGHRPSVTMTFRSVAEVFGKSAGAVLLTGMGNDGADGLKVLSDVGALTIAQDEATSVVFGMPGSAIALGAARFILPVEAIARMLVAQVGTLGVQT